MLPEGISSVRMSETLALEIINSNELIGPWRIIDDIKIKSSADIILLKRNHHTGFKKAFKFQLEVVFICDNSLWIMLFLYQYNLHNRDVRV